MITNLALEQFRSFQERQSIELAPLTLVYGPNSAGKSSIIKSLLLLQQSVLFSNSPFPMWRGPQVDLGSVWDSVHAHQENGAMKIGFTLKLGTEVTRGPEKSIFTGADIEFEYSIKGHQHDKVGIEFVSGEKRSGRLGFERCGPNESLWILNRDSLFSYLSLREDLGVTQQGTLFPASDHLPVFYSDGLLPSRVFGYFDGGIQKRQGIEHSSLDFFWNSISTDLVQEFRNEMSNISYLGPLRKQWSRTEDVGQSSNSPVPGSAGENSLSFLKDKPDLLARVNKALNETLECGYQLHLGTPTYTIEGSDGRKIDAPQVIPMLEHLTSNVFISPVDAGFGLSQLLPILVEMFMRENSLILIEQPELHLHPRLQARMGQLFRNAVLGWNHNRFIIETHSEHIVLRIRSLIRKRLLDPNIVKVLYVNNQEFRSDEDSLQRDDAMFTTLNSQVMSLRLDEYGDFIDPWPNGFFDERFEELAGTEPVEIASDDETGGFGMTTD